MVTPMGRGSFGGSGWGNGRGAGLGKQGAGLGERDAAACCRDLWFVWAGCVAFLIGKTIATYWDIIRVWKSRNVVDAVPDAQWIQREIV